MNSIKNAYYRLEFQFLRIIKSKRLTVAPIQWREPLMRDNHRPSDQFMKKLSTEQIEKLNQILKEFKLFSSLTTTFPSQIKDDQWMVILECQSRKQRLDQLIFLHRNEKLRQKEVQRKFEKQLNEKIKSENKDREGLMLGTTYTEKRQLWIKCLEAFRLDAPTLVVDCQFLTKLSPRGRQLTLSQLNYLVGENRLSENPMRLYFANYDKSNQRLKELQEKKLPGLLNESRISPIVEERSFTEIFDPERIVYLSPDADQTLKTVDDDKVYVIGGIVDRVHEPGIDKNASQQAAERCGVRCARLPIEDYIEFKSGSKFLTLLAVMNILRDVNQYGDWHAALRKWVPVRNQKGVEEKNLAMRDKHNRIREFNRRILKIVDYKMSF